MFRERDIEFLDTARLYRNFRKKALTAGTTGTSKSRESLVNFYIGHLPRVLEDTLNRALDCVKEHAGLSVQQREEPSADLMDTGMGIDRLCARLEYVKESDDLRQMKRTLEQGKDVSISEVEFLRKTLAHMAEEKEEADAARKQADQRLMTITKE